MIVLSIVLSVKVKNREKRRMNFIMDATLLYGILLPTAIISYTICDYNRTPANKLLLARGVSRTLHKQYGKVWVNTKP